MMVLTEQTVDAFIGMAAKRFYELGVHSWRVYPIVVKFDKVNKVVLRFVMRKGVVNPVDPDLSVLSSSLWLDRGNTLNDFNKRLESALLDMEEERQRVGSTIRKSPFVGVGVEWSKLFTETTLGTM